MGSKRNFSLIHSSKIPVRQDCLQGELLTRRIRMKMHCENQQIFEGFNDQGIGNLFSTGVEYSRFQIRTLLERCNTHMDAYTLAIRPLFNAQFAKTDFGRWKCIFWWFES